MAQLPKQAQRKLATLERASTDSFTLAEAAKASCQLLRGKLAALTTNTAPEAELAAVRVELADAETALADHQRRAANDRQVVAQLNGWLRQLPPGAMLEVFAVPFAKPRRGLTALETVQTLREELNKLQGDLRRLQAAPATAAELRASAAEIVQRLAERGRPKLSAERCALSVTWRPDSSWQAGNGALAHIEFMAWLDPAALTARLHAEVDAMPISADAISAADKAPRIAELEAQIFDLSCQEESLISQAASAGQFIARRPRASPLAVLGVQLKSAARKAA